MTISVDRRTVNQPQVGDRLTLTEDLLNWTKVPKCVAEDDLKSTNASSAFLGMKFKLTAYEFEWKTW